MKKLLIIGPYPNPKGGVSIHIKRLNEMLTFKYDVLKIDEAPIKKDDIFNVRSLNLINYIRKFLDADIVHIHSSVDIFRIIHIITSKALSKKVVLTIHSFRSKNILIKKTLFFLFGKVEKILVVNESIAEDLYSIKSDIKPAFLPPLDIELTDISDYLRDVIDEKRKNGYLIVSSNAYKLVDFNGEDLYGLDLFIELADKFKGSKIFFIFQLGSVGDNPSKQKYKDYIKMVNEKGLKNIKILIEPISFVALILKSDCTLRLTNTDGDALSIRESLYLDVPIIASDVVTRPKGTILFKNRSIKSLITVFHRHLENRTLHKNKVRLNAGSNSFINFYDNIYSNL